MEPSTSYPAPTTPPWVGPSPPPLTHLQVKDKFCLDLNEEEAVQRFQSLIDESVKAMMAVFVEQIHKWAQVGRSSIHLFNPLGSQFSRIHEEGG